MQHGGLVASGRCEVPGGRYRIASGGCLDARLAATTALLRAPIAKVLCGGVFPRVGSMREVPIAGRLIAVGRNLVLFRRGLILVSGRLVGIRERLVGVSERLVGVQRAGPPADAALVSLDVSVIGFRARHPYQL
jgi:hypothetical protein